MDDSLSRGLFFSVMLHVGVLLVMAFGLPILFPDDHEIEPMAITVEIVPIKDITNLPTSEKAPQEKKEDVAKNEKPVPKTMQEKAEPEPKKPEEVVPDPDAPKEEKKKEEPKKEEEKKEKPKDDFAVLMSKLKQEKPNESKEDDKEKESASESTSKSTKYDPTIPLSISEKDAIRSQFVKCWRMPAGAKNAHELAVRVRVLMNPDATVKDVGLVPDQVGRYQTDPFFRGAADSAMRAVWKCSPLQDLPADKYSTWQDMELNFDPSELLY